MDKYHISTTREGLQEEINPWICARRELGVKTKQTKKQHRRTCQTRGAGSPKKVQYRWEHDRLHVP